MYKFTFFIAFATQITKSGFFSRVTYCRWYFPILLYWLSWSSNHIIFVSYYCNLNVLGSFFSELLKPNVMDVIERFLIWYIENQYCTIGISEIHAGQTSKLVLAAYIPNLKLNFPATLIKKQRSIVFPTSNSRFLFLREVIIYKSMYQWSFTWLRISKKYYFADIRIVLKLIENFIDVLIWLSLLLAWLNIYSSSIHYFLSNI